MMRYVDKEKMLKISEWFRVLKDKVYENRNADIMEDGIVDMNLYANAKTRIMWVLMLHF